METNELRKIRHSLAHLLAAAVKALWPDVKPTIGPAIDNGFYYDFEFDKPISEEDLPKIEARMREILPTWERFLEIRVSPGEARSHFKENEYKLELIDELTAKGEKITVYRSGDFTDLCRGGHVENINEIAPAGFKLDRLAGAYWRGDEKNKMLTRIYGLAFASKAELKGYLARREEAERRDHKKLGRELDLFTFSDLVGSGLPLFTPKGTLIRDLLDSFVWKLRQKHGYERVDIPHLAKKELYRVSGHWEKFQNELFQIKTREGHHFVLKPMNCPHHVEIFNRRQWSYRELPQRYASTTKVYRDEQSGELSGLARVRAITQDDAHVFCRFNQVGYEINTVWYIVKDFYSTFGLSIRYVRLSLHDPQHPEKYLGSPAIWKEAEDNLRTIAREHGTELVEAPGEAVFYGPKVDFMVTDSLGREWQLATIQLDMNMPERFDLFCINEKGEKERIVMIHTAIMGSIERFMAILIEQYVGAFPVWLAPVQVLILPISEAHREYAELIAAQLGKEDLRVEINAADETLSKRVREGKLAKIPYLLVLGDEEVKSKTLTAESRDRGKHANLKIEDFIHLVSADRPKT